MKKLNNVAQVPTVHLVIWWVIRGILIIWGINGLFHGHTTVFIQSLFAIAFTHLWDMFQLFGKHSFISEVEYTPQTLLNIFIFFGCVMGTTTGVFEAWESYDMVQHFTSGLICGWFGYDFAVIIQGRKHPIKPAMAALFAVGFGLVVAVGWEFYEFSMDRLYGMNLQCSSLTSESGLIDTMTDLILGSSGTLLGMFYSAFKRNGIIGKNRHEIRARLKAQREIEVAELEAERAIERAKREEKYGE